MDKKAVIGMSFVDFWSLTLIVIVIIGFSLLFAVSGLIIGGQSRMLEASSKMDADNMLLGLLKRDSGNGGSVASEIIKNKDELGAVNSLLEQELDEICNLQKDQCSINLYIIVDGKEKIITPSSSKSKNLKLEFISESKTILPVKDGKILVKLFLYTGRIQTNERAV